jgi:hypothetical protein
MSMEGSSLAVCFSSVLWIGRGAEGWFLLTAGVLSTQYSLMQCTYAKYGCCGRFLPMTEAPRESIHGESREMSPLFSLPGRNTQTHTTRRIGVPFCHTSEAGQSINLKFTEKRIQSRCGQEFQWQRAIPDMTRQTGRGDR